MLFAVVTVAVATDALATVVIGVQAIGGTFVTDEPSPMKDGAVIGSVDTKELVEIVNLFVLTTENPRLVVVGKYIPVLPSDDLKAGAVGADAPES